MRAAKKWIVENKEIILMIINIHKNNASFIQKKIMIAMINKCYNTVPIDVAQMVYEMLYLVFRTV